METSKCAVSDMTSVFFGGGAEQEYIRAINGIILLYTEDYRIHK